MNQPLRFSEWDQDALREAWAAEARPWVPESPVKSAIRDLMQDHRWRTTEEVSERLGIGTKSVGRNLSAVGCEMEEIWERPLDGIGGSRIVRMWRLPQ